MTPEKPPIRITAEIIYDWLGMMPTPPEGYEWMALPNADIWELRERGEHAPA